MSAKRRALRVAVAAATLGAALPAAAAECGDLTGMALASGRVTSAGLVAPGAFQIPRAPGAPQPSPALLEAYRALPEFCRVEATLTPTAGSDIKVEVWLPARAWNGKFVGVGNGTWAGRLRHEHLGAPLARGYAVATTDTGHSGDGTSAEWAVGHPEKLVDFGHRAVHEMTVAAKQAIATFYGQGPSLSLWNSCSTGGRQGLMEAYRYPADFDAISAMAPANPMTTLMTQSVWSGWQPQRAPGAALPMPALGTLHRAAVARCDALDGGTDGLIARPEVCRFDPVEVQCKRGQAAGDSCLSPVQVGTARALYGGIRNRRNGDLLAPGWPVGSELELPRVVGGPTPFPTALTYFSMLVFGDRPSWDWRRFDYTRDLATGQAYGAGILDVPHDGLGPFFARGGKLLLSHGWADGLIPATNTTLFHSQLYRALPAAQAQDQLRLFMVPGMNHCSGGEGPSQFDTLGVIDRWATSGVAPDTILATRPAGSGPPLSRPLCPYPLYARYDGDGDLTLAENFRCVAPG